MNQYHQYHQHPQHPRIGQARWHSVTEAFVGTAIGFIISWALLSFIISPLFGLHTNHSENFLITCIFTVASVLRSYIVRRAFNWWHLWSSGRIG